MIYVSSLSGLASVAGALGRFDLLTLLSPGHAGDGHRGLGAGRHLQLDFHDINEPTPGLLAPDAGTVRAILDFGRAPKNPLLIHCWAGISRSSAAAFAIACDRNPGFERAIAMELRRRAPSATPNRLMVKLADDLLGRDGGMVEAIAAIGRGADAFEGAPYQLPLNWPIG
ncbi:tyrosine protein phosphatase [Rhodopseudomonas sp.]|uniref:tyrosine phosphatase family protein n=1 Tax=Rhodopseudomonas sp. TaxID=1078 RepID=UPI0025E405B2|nr:tyrosine protein phosphatase [Rhodopseudomonas sp.]